ncbi:hypothetical protein PHMEG_0008912 [Phytophthora megakarya]|uniref:Reverse transcriptase/retrotransposon-derived protein RNase H-like domain-containing protein n=1 Tax=Phytophthora megakarya TaxID=4795 RepID=A0A225WK07_9STRA|nr:hypothetical protein PHMEG_0008912 [Phytophthora megakarya]
MKFAVLPLKVADAPILRHYDRDKTVHVTLFANEWALSSTLLQEHDEKLHPVRFCGRVLKDAEMNYHQAKNEVLALLVLLKGCYIHHPSERKDCAFAQLLQAELTSFVDLDDALAAVAPPTKGSLTVRVDPELLYAHLPTSYEGLVMSFDGSAKTDKYGGFSRVNRAENSGMNNGVVAALDHGVEHLMIVGNSSLAIQQSLGVVLNSVRYLHVVREYNAAIDYLASEALESKTSNVVWCSGSEVPRE